MRLADEKSKCVSLQSRPLREFGQSRWSERIGSGFRCKLPFIKCINHYSLISFHFSSETDGVKCVHGSALPRRGVLPQFATHCTRLRDYEHRINPIDTDETDLIIED